MSETVSITLTDEQVDRLREDRVFGGFGCEVYADVLDAVADALPATKPEIKPWNWYRDEAGRTRLVTDARDGIDLIHTATPNGTPGRWNRHEVIGWELIGPCEVPS